MNEQQDTHFKTIGYVVWIFGFLGAHRMYQQKWLTAILYLFTGGIFGLGILYDFWTLNDQISVQNAQKRV